mgnify:CR=1 FL=1
MSEEMKRFELTLIDNEQVGVDYFIFNFEMPKGLIYKEGQYGAFKHVDKEIEGRKVRALTLASKCDEEVLKIATVINDSPRYKPMSRNRCPLGTSFAIYYLASIYNAAF